MFYRWGLLYPLYVLSEIGIIFVSFVLSCLRFSAHLADFSSISIVRQTDLAELLGSAIAINLYVTSLSRGDGLSKGHSIAYASERSS